MLIGIMIHAHVRVQKFCQFLPYGSGADLGVTEANCFLSFLMAFILQYVVLGKSVVPCQKDKEVGLRSDRV